MIHLTINLKKLIYVLCFGEAPVPKRYEILRKSKTIVISVVWAAVWSQEANWSCDKFWFFGAGKVIWWAKGGIERRCPATGAHSRRFLFSVVSEGRAVSQVAGKAPFTPAWLLCTLQGCSRMLNHCSCCPPKLHSWLLLSHVACRYKPRGNSGSTAYWWSDTALTCDWFQHNCPLHKGHRDWCKRPCPYFCCI